MKQYIFSKQLTVLFLTFFIIACGTKKDDSKVISNKVSANGILVDNFDQYRDSAPVTIKTLDLYENTLFLNISYSGGCESHEFKLLGMRSIIKTNPPARELMLYHNSNNDHCRELIEKKLKIDISPFGMEGGKPIILKLKGWKKPVKYTLSK